MQALSSISIVFIITIIILVETKVAASINIKRYVSKTGPAGVRVGLMEGRRALVAVFLQALTTVCHLRPPSHYFSRCIFA